MVTIKKKDKKSSIVQLVTVLSRFIYLLEGQKETEAVQDLRIASEDIQKFVPGSIEFKAALSLIIEAFDGKHELNIYTTCKENTSGKWTEAEELYLVSVDVYNLTKRINKSMK